MSPYTDQPDLELVRLTREGESSAFGEIARRYQSPVLRFLKRKLNPADAEDVAQTTFLKAFERLHSFRPGTLKSWLMGIAYHEMIDTFRRRKLMRTSREQVDAIDESHPADAVATAEAGARLWTIAKQTLTTEQFSALWLFYGEDLSAPEIATALNRSWVSTKVLLHRARATLRKAIDAPPIALATTISSAGDA